MLCNLGIYLYNNNYVMIIYLGEFVMSESKVISIDQSKGNINDYIIKDKDSILIGRFTITELDKESKKCNIRLKFFKDDKHNLLREQ